MENIRNKSIDELTLLQQAEPSLRVSVRDELIQRLKAFSDDDLLSIALKPDCNKLGTVRVIRRPCLVLLARKEICFRQNELRKLTNEILREEKLRPRSYNCLPGYD